MEFPILVYGTLKRGESNHTLLSGSMFVGEDAVRGDLFDLGPFPAMKEGEGTVHGEVFLVSTETLKALDHLEGHPVFYRRTPVETLFGKKPVQVYFYQDDFHGIVKKLPDGVWQRNVKFGT